MADAREDIGVFAEKVLGRRLWPHQLEVAQSNTFICVAAGARRTGKTELAEALSIRTALWHRGCQVVILSATADQARRVTESVAETVNRSQVTRGAVVDDFATRIRFTNGSEIISIPAHQTRGLGKRVQLVIVDEAGFCPADNWSAIHYIALDNRARGSRILLLGTPWGSADHFFRRAFEAGRRGDPDYASWSWPASVNPALDHDYLERQRHRVSPSEYAAEVLGEWSDAAGALFPRELLDACTADLELPVLGELQPPARGIIGLDWGVSFDRSAAAMLYRVPCSTLSPATEWKPRFVVVPEIWPQKTALGAVVDAVVSAAAPFHFYSVETNGVGAMPAQELVRRVAGTGNQQRKWNHVSTTAAKKTAGYSLLLGLMEREQIILPRHPDLLRQLAGLRFEQGERGFMRIEADDPATHDDVADALYIATLPYTAKNGRVLCGLSVLADPERATPEAAPPGDYWDDDIATTGSGLSVWRRPPLQSVAGGELTLPVHADGSEATTQAQQVPIEDQVQPRLGGERDVR